MPAHAIETEFARCQKDGIEPRGAGIFGGARNCSLFYLSSEGHQDFSYSVGRLFLRSMERQQGNRETFLKIALISFFP